MGKKVRQKTRLKKNERKKRIHANLKKKQEKRFASSTEKLGPHCATKVTA